MGRSMQSLIGNVDLCRICSGLRRVKNVISSGSLKKIVQWYWGNENWWQPLFNCQGVGQRLGANP